MTLYKYNRQGYFIEAFQAEVNRKATRMAGETRYFEYDLATPVAPPPVKDGHRIKWDGSAWNYEEIPAPPAPPEPTEEEILKAEISEQKAVLCSTDWVQSKLGEKFLFKLLEVYARDGTTGIGRLDEVMEYMTPLLSQYAKVFAERETARAEINRKEKDS